MICSSTVRKPVSLTCWINKNLFSSNKIWWGDNFASVQHKALSHVQGCCALRANQMKVWRGSSAHGGQDDRERYGWSSPPLGTGLHVPTKLASEMQVKSLFVPSKVIQWVTNKHEYIISFSQYYWYTWRKQYMVEWISHCIIKSNIPFVLSKITWKGILTTLTVHSTFFGMKNSQSNLNPTETSL